MKRYLLLLLVLGLVSVTTLGQGSVAPKRVRLLVTDTTDFAPNTLIVAAEGVDGVAGAGTDIITNDVTSYCDIHFNSVTVETNTATLIGQVVAASDPVNFGAFVKVTANKANGKATFVFETLTGVGSTGPAGVPMTGTVQIAALPPPA